MQAGTFNTVNDAVSKFVISSTETTGQPNNVPYFKNYSGYFHCRNNIYNNIGTQYNNGRGQYRGNSRGRGK